MKIARKTRAKIELNLSPLIDVIFILVIFIILVAEFVDQNQLDINVPKSKAGKPASLEALVINVTGDGLIMIGDKMVERDDVSELLKPLSKKHDRVLLMADSQTALQLAIDILGAAKEAGFKQVSIATSEEDS